MEKNNIISDWLDQYGDPEIYKKVENILEKREIKKCVGEIIDTLCERSGFDDWWYNLDDEIEKEITDKLEEIVKRRFERHNK